jgi:hypothetical protein
MGTMHQNRKGVPEKTKKSELKKKGENVAVYKDKLMIMKSKHKNDICLTSTTYDEKLVQIGFEAKMTSSPK